MQKVDARGLTCPQPIMKMLAAMKQQENCELEITVDNETSKENIIRTVEGKGWKILDVKSIDDDHIIAVKK